MRESEEYLNNAEKCIGEDWYVATGNAEHAVKLAYKEGYLEDIQDALDNLTGYTELASWDVEQILERLKKELKN